MAVTRDEVLYLAKLSALHLSEQEVDRLTGDLESIVDYFNQLQEVDTSDVEPLLQVVEGLHAPLQQGVDLYPDADWLLQNTKHQIHHRNIIVTNKKATGGES